MSSVAHPIHLLPKTVTIKFHCVLPMTVKQVQDYVNYIIQDYFDNSLYARRLWHDHAEGMLSDEEWLDMTLDAIQAHSNDKLNETD